MNSPRILFMGTPDFAAVQLEYLAEKGYNISGVVCRPDSAKNRGMKLIPPPVKVSAQQFLAGVPVYQPASLRDGAGESILAETSPDLIVVVAYGRILPKSVLDYPKFGCINLHGSILPAYRGAAPIQRAIMNGDKTTGLSLMYLSEGMDEGDVFDTVETPIGETETYGELSSRLAALGREFLARGIDSVFSGTAKAVPQDPAFVTYAPMIEKAEAKLDFAMDAERVCNVFRAVTPNPGAATVRAGRQLRINSMRVYRGDIPELPAGTVFFPTRKTACVVCGSGAVELLRLSPEGRRETAVSDLINGRGLAAGDVLG
ncbi:MAG: methionyl-tRNA formyltransferase [Clostridiales bacterium]|nr:methionyl-tRNA formyltransferase [Clostridiales bacterium]